MVYSSADSDAQDQYFFVEPLDVTTGTKVTRDRLALLVTDGTLADTISCAATTSSWARPRSACFGGADP